MKNEKHTNFIRQIKKFVTNQNKKSNQSEKIWIIKKIKNLRRI
jgi:hypothetical protein